VTERHGAVNCRLVWTTFFFFFEPIYIPEYKP
jgi:hypothetical protein